MVVNKLYKRKIPKQGNSRGEIERERESFSDLQSFLLLHCSFWKQEREKIVGRKGKRNPILFFFFEIQRRFFVHFSSRWSRIYIIFGIEFRVRILVLEAETGRKFTQFRSKVLKLLALIMKSWTFELVFDFNYG